MKTIEKLEFAISVEPKAKQSFKYGKDKKGFIRKYTPAKTKNYQRSLEYQILQHLPSGFKIHMGPVVIDKCIFIFPPLKSFSKKKLKAIEEGEVIYKTTTPDLTDNLPKPLYDAMQGLVFANDGQICHINNVSKQYGFNPGIYITVRLLEA